MSGKLDFSLMPGDRSMKRWQQSVNWHLSQKPEFTRAGKEGHATIWRLNNTHMPAEPASKAIKREKGNFMEKGKSMGQGGH